MNKINKIKELYVRVPARTKSISDSANKLERLEKRRDKIKSLLSVKNELSKSFYGGMVGFKNGAGRKKWERSIDKELDLMRELKEVEIKIDKIINPIKRSVAPFVSPEVFNVGDKVYHQGAGLSGKCVITVSGFA